MAAHAKTLPLQWVDQFGSASHDAAHGVAVDKQGNSYTVGEFSGTVDFDPGPGTFNLTSAGLLTAASAMPGALALACSFLGMFMGQAARSRLQPEAFRRWFQIGMIALGLYLAGNALTKLV